MRPKREFLVTHRATSQAAVSHIFSFVWQRPPTPDTNLPLRPSMPPTHSQQSTYIALVKQE
jgi:hypothetical protein